MDSYFLDSSALVKRYVRETGSGWVGQLTQPGAGNTLIVSEISFVEVI
ncbi:MAG: type II toxin-antitoxin system VapC family toxin, partial [Verrucomicrobia bacterium]|nr:type II toxin-antitoxin system VapC family toxin [Verrucomicrobiota bacterium]